MGTVGGTLVTVSHLIPISMAYELVPAYSDADPAGQATLAATFDTFAATALVTNSAGNFLGWGVAVPMFAVAILRTGALPRWIGWLGILVGVLAGWLGLLSPASGVIEGISSIGFIGFFVFMLAIGVAILRRHDTRQSVDIQWARERSGRAPHTSVPAAIRSPERCVLPPQSRTFCNALTCRCPCSLMPMSGSSGSACANTLWAV